MTTRSIIDVPSRNKQLLFVQKEIHKIQNDSNFNKTTQFIINESNLAEFTMVITPIEGLYKDVTISFQLKVPTNYPAPGNPIEIKCLNNIYHPNVFQQGKLCLKYDGIGDLDTGYKETLENLVVAINYMFIHPENYDHSDKKMPESMKRTILTNLKEYKSRIANQTSIIYKSKETYSDDINETLKSIEGWETYLPNIVVDKKIETSKKNSRYYVMTLSGRKVMSIALLENVLSQIIRDPRYRFDRFDNLAFVKNNFQIEQILKPETSHSVIMSKFKRLIFPNDIKYEPINKCYNSNMHFGGIFNTKSFLNCNIHIRSNYRFKFTSIKEQNPYEPVLDSSFCNETKEYEMKIEQYICQTKDYCNNSYLMIYDEPDPLKPLWFYFSFSMLIVGKDIKNMFSNVAFRLNPLDKTSPYVTLNNHPTNDRFAKPGVRFLTEHEHKLINDPQDDAEVNGTDYDINLAAKYLAENEEQSGLKFSTVY
jgi:ubiquitin-protein ligase